MKYAVAELEGARLDEAVAKAEGIDVWVDDGVCWREYHNCNARWTATESWAVAGQIIERERIVVGPADDSEWVAYADGATITDHGSDTLTGSNTYGVGSTPLIAAMRAYVASKFGAEVDL